MSREIERDRDRQREIVRQRDRERLLSTLNESESVESEKNFDNARKKEIKEEFHKLRDRFCRPKIDQKKSL